MVTDSESVIGYIKSKYPKIIFSPVKFPYTQALGFIISEGKLLVGYINKAGVLCKLSNPVDLQSLANQGLEDIIAKLPIVSGFTDKDKENLLTLVNGRKSKLVTNAEQDKLVIDLKRKIEDLNIQDAKYKVMFDANTKDTVLIKQQYVDQLDKLQKSYDDAQANLESCKREVLENKQVVLDNLEKYKAEMKAYISNSDLSKSELKELHAKILKEKETADANLDVVVKREAKLNAEQLLQIQVLQEKLDVSEALLQKITQEKMELEQLNKSQMEGQEETSKEQQQLQQQFDSVLAEKQALQTELTNKQTDVSKFSDNAAEIKAQLEGLQKEFDKETMARLALEGSQSKCKAQILNEKKTIIDGIKAYNQKWEEWGSKVTTNFEEHKKKIVSDLLTLQNAFDTLLNANPKESKLKQNINDIERELRNTIANQLISLNSKEQEIKTLNDNSTTTLKERDQTIQRLQDELAEVRALLVANETTKVQTVDYDDCYGIIQNFFALNNIFFRKQEIIKRLDDIINKNIGVFYNLEPTVQNDIKKRFSYVKEEINKHIKFLDLKRYISDPNFGYLKSKATRNKVPAEFCNELTNILEYWNINKANYREQDIVLTNIYEDLSGAVRVYIRIKPLVGLEQKERAVDIQLVEKKKQRFVTLDCQTAKEKVYGEFYGVFEESFTNQNVFTGIEQEMKETTDFKLDLDEIMESSDTTSPGLYSTFKQVEDGYSIVLFGYGVSGSGKSHSLLGTRGTPGLLHYGLSNLQGVANIRLRNLFEQHHGLMNINFNKMTGKIHNLVGKVPKFEQFSVDETKLFKSNLNFDNISVSDISILTEQIEQYRIENKRIKKTPNNPVSSRSHLYFVFQITFINGKEGYVTLVDTAGRESPLDIFKTFMEPGKVKLASLMSPIGGVDLIAKHLDKAHSNDYSPQHIFELLKEGYFINESINHLIYYFNKKNYRAIRTVMQSTDPEKYQVGNYYVNPASEETTISNSNNCLMIPILNYLDNLSRKQKVGWRPTKFLMLCMVRQEKTYCDQTIETLQFANAIKSS